ncbi:hypothetical protein BJQ93_03440 [Bacillus subtilis]|jgi:hypothetical protein|nr:hypothetical protein [Bacillus subtilis]
MLNYSFLGGLFASFVFENFVEYPAANKKMIVSTYPNIPWLNTNIDIKLDVIAKMMKIIVYTFKRM